MNVSSAAFTVILGAVFGAGTLTVAILNAFVGRGGRRADIANHISEASDRLIQRFENELDDFDKVKAQCRQCQTALEAVEARERKQLAVIRLVVRALESRDETAIQEAVVAARELI